MGHSGALGRHPRGRAGHARSPRTGPGKRVRWQVNGETITAKDVEKSLGAKLQKLEEQIYTLKRAEVDALIAQHLLAQEARSGASPSPH